MSIDVERLAGGRLRFTTPQAPDWAMHARTDVHSLAKGVQAAMVAAAREADVQAYRDRRRERPPTRRTGTTTDTGRAVFRRSHDPAAWSKLPNGRWKSPGGLTYREDAAVVQRVLAARARETVKPAPPSSPGGQP